MGLKEQLLRSKMAALRDTLERRDAQLNAALPGEASRRPQVPQPAGPSHQDSS